MNVQATRVALDIKPVIEEIVVGLSVSEKSPWQRGDAKGFLSIRCDA